MSLSPRSSENIAPLSRSASSPWRGLAIALAAAASALFLPALASAAGPCTPEASWGTVDPAAASEVIRLVNEHRQGLNLQPLKVSQALSRAATWKALHMATNNYYSHNDEGVGAAPGRDPWQRAIDCGYPIAAGENLTGGSTASYAVASWLASPPHRRAIEQPNAIVTGVALGHAGGSYYWVQMFGTFDDSGVNAGPAPATVGESVSVRSGGEVLIDTLANDSGATTLLLGPISKPTYGRTRVVGGKILFLADNGLPGPDSFRGTASFSYTVVDLNGKSARATVAVTVTAGAAGLKISGSLTKSRFRASSLEAVKFSYRLSVGASTRFRLERRTSEGWLGLGRTPARQLAAGRVYSRSLKSLFGGKWAKPGSYRITIDAGKNVERDDAVHKTLTFTVLPPA